MGREAPHQTRALGACQNPELRRNHQEVHPAEGHNQEVHPAEGHNREVRPAQDRNREVLLAERRKREEPLAEDRNREVLLAERRKREEPPAEDRNREVLLAERRKREVLLVARRNRGVRPEEGYSPDRLRSPAQPGARRTEQRHPGALLQVADRSQPGPQRAGGRSPARRACRRWCIGGRLAAAVLRSSCS